MEPIMEFIIELKPETINELQSTQHKVKFIPFTGHVDSPIFKGTILPGAADIQVTDPAGVNHMCAKYMFDGTDENGDQCRLYVENNGYFQRGMHPHPFEAYPTFITDSVALQKHLNKTTFRSEGHSWEKGVIIKIFEV